MMGKSIPLNNGQRKERICVVNGCSRYLDEMEGMHVSCQSKRVIDILRKGNSNQVTVLDTPSFRPVAQIINLGH